MVRLTKARTRGSTGETVTHVTSDISQHLVIIVVIIIIVVILVNAFVMRVSVSLPAR